MLFEEHLRTDLSVVVMFLDKPLSFFEGQLFFDDLLLSPQLSIDHSVNEKPFPVVYFSPLQFYSTLSSWSLKLSKSSETSRKLPARGICKEFTLTS